MTTEIQIYDTGNQPPFGSGAAMVYYRRMWSDEWQLEHTVEVTSINIQAGSAGYATASLRREYGEVKGPHEDEQQTYSPITWDGYWCRITVWQGNAEHEVLVGRVYNVSRNVYHEGDDDHVMGGVQTFQVVGGERILERISLSSSVWAIDRGEETVSQVLQRLPDINVRDEHRGIVGNRSADKLGDAYAFGGVELWTHYDVLEYLLVRYIQQTTGPTWRLAGQASDLATMTDHVRLGDATTVADVIRQVVRPELGYDWYVRRYTVGDGEGGVIEGFEIVVYALTAENWAIGEDVVVPANPDTVRITAPLPPDMMRLQFASSSDQSYRRIRVLGNRIVTALTLNGAGVDAAAEVANSLENGWTSALETLYLQGTGLPGDPAELHDLYRAESRFRPVFQRFVAPSDWDWHNGLAAIAIDANGEIDPAGGADRQNVVRSTLTWLPMREGVDYLSGDPPYTDNNPDGLQPDLLPPMAWLWSRTSERWVLAEEVGFHVGVLRNEWGITISGSPNHRLALDAWDGASASEYDPEYDPTEIMTTIAVQGDQRIEVGYDVPMQLVGGAGGAVDDDGDVLEIVVPDAEMWVLAPYCVIGMDDNSVPRATSTPIVVRDDTARLRQVLVGAMSRYINQRNRASITIAGLLPWAHLLGRVLTTVEEGDTETTVQAVITSIDWSLDVTRPQTVIRTGYA
jgi:hypothetical protein